MASGTQNFSSVRRTNHHELMLDLRSHRSVVCFSFSSSPPYWSRCSQDAPKASFFLGHEDPLKPLFFGWLPSISILQHENRPAGLWSGRASGAGIFHAAAGGPPETALLGP